MPPPAEEWCRASIGWSYPQALSVVALVSVWSGLWLWAVGRRLKQPGAARLAAAAPVVAANLALPKLFCRWVDSTTIVLVAFNCAWICSFKVRGERLG